MSGRFQHIELHPSRLPVAPVQPCITAVPDFWLAAARPAKRVHSRDTRFLRRRQILSFGASAAVTIAACWAEPIPPEPSSQAPTTTA